MSFKSKFDRPLENDVSQYTRMLKTLVLALRKLPLYPSGHRIIKTAINDPFRLLGQYLEKDKELTVGIKEDRILVEDKPLDTKEAWVTSFITDLKKLDIQTITFYKGLSIEELENFLRVLSANPDQIKSEGSIQELLIKKDITHVKFDQVLYEKVTDEVKKVSADDLKKVAEETLAAMEDQTEPEPEPDENQAIAGYIAGRIERLDLEPAEVKKKIENNAKEIATLVYKQIPGKKTEKKVLELLSQKLKKIGGTETEAIKLTKELIYAFPKKKISKAKQESAKLKKTSEQIAAENAELKKKLAKLENQMGQKELLSEKHPEPETKELSKKETDPDDPREKIAALEKELELKTKTGEQLKKTNRKLAREKQRVDTVIRNIGDGLVVVDDRGKVLLMNPAAEKLLGTTQKENLGESLSKSMKDEHVLALTKGGGSEESEKSHEEIELISSQDETRKIIQASTAVVENKDGKTIGMVSMLHDVTKQKEIEELKSRFVSLVSHELRTPLVAIEKNMSVLLEKVAGEINEDQEKFLSAAQRNAARLHRLVNDLLDLSKIEAKKMELNVEKVKPNKIIDDILSELKVWFEDKKIRVKMDLCPEDPVLEADADKFSQVLNNLVGNAVKFTPEGGLVQVSSAVKETVSPLEGRGFIQIDVKDTGIGLAESDKERVFNKFEQVSLISPAGVGGTGLGLPITREIILLHGGHIWVESVLGQGCTFSFALPLQSRKVH